MQHHPWSITPDYKEEIRHNPLLDPEKNLKLLDKNLRTRLLRTKPRNFRYIGKIQLRRDEFPDLHEWEEYQRHRYSEFEKLDEVRRIMDSFPFRVRLTNPKPMIEDRYVSSPYHTPLTYLVKLPNSEFDLITISF